MNRRKKPKETQQQNTRNNHIKNKQQTQTSTNNMKYTNEQL